MLSEGSMSLRTDDRHGVVWIELNLGRSSCPSAWRCDDALA